MKAFYELEKIYSDKVFIFIVKNLIPRMALCKTKLFASMFNVRFFFKLTFVEKLFYEIKVVLEVEWIAYIAQIPSFLQ